MAAIKDVAKLAGLSVAAVSKYLKNPDSVRKDTRCKIESAIDSLHYVPSPIARSLRTKRTGMIAVVVPDITNPFFAELFEAIRQSCIARSMLAILQTAQDQEETDQTIQSMLSRQVDGVIICFPDQETLHHQLREKAPDLPVTIMGWHNNGSSSGNVILDVKQGIYEATQHLLQKNCRRIAYIGGAKDSIISCEKRKGFIDAMSDAGLTPENGMMKQGKTTMRYGHDATQEIFDHNPEIHAVVCENDALAIGCITYCLHHQVRVPEQLLVTGFDDISLAEMYEPQITTVRLPIEEMGECAVDITVRRMDGGTQEADHVFATTLIVRKSTDSLIV